MSFIFRFGEKLKGLTLYANLLQI